MNYNMDSDITFYIIAWTFVQVWKRRLSSGAVYFVYWKQGLSLAFNSPDVPRWPARESQGHAHLCLLSTGITSTCQHASIFPWGLEIKLGSPCCHGKPFIDRAISQPSTCSSVLKDPLFTGPSSHLVIPTPHCAISKPFIHLFRGYAVHPRVCLLSYTVSFLDGLFFPFLPFLPHLVSV